MNSHINQFEGIRKGNVIIRKGKGLPSAETNDATLGIKKEDKKEVDVKKRSEFFQKYFEMDGQKKIKMEDFAGIYRDDTIRKDKERVENFINSEEYREPTPESVVLENVISELSEFNDWFLDKNGNNEFFSCQLSEFDDKMADGARADMALEIKTPEGEIIRLLLDVTTSVDESRLKAKRDKCTEKIKEKRLHSVKYFQSELDGKKGRQGDLPMVVVGMDPERLLEFCGRAAENRDLSNDYAAFMLLDEIKEQLMHDYIFSVEKHGENDRITQILLKTYKTFSAVLETKNNLRPHDFEEKVVKDEVYNYLTTKLDR